MTGTQYWQLSEGDICILTEDLDLYHWKKGDKIVVVYRDRFEESVYVCNISVKIHGRFAYAKISAVYFLKAMVVDYSTCTYFTHKYNVGDTVWYTEDNKPRFGKIISIIYYYKNDKNYDSVQYVITGGYNFYEDEIYSSKEELINNL